MFPDMFPFGRPSLLLHFFITITLQTSSLTKGTISKQLGKVKHFWKIHPLILGKGPFPPFPPLSFYWNRAFALKTPNTTTFFRVPSIPLQNIVDKAFCVHLGKFLMVISDSNIILSDSIDLKHTLGKFEV